MPGRTSLVSTTLQLREKQKVKRLYGLLERQFAKLMNEATRREGQTGKCCCSSRETADKRGVPGPFLRRLAVLPGNWSHTVTLH